MSGLCVSSFVRGLLLTTAFLFSLMSEAKVDREYWPTQSPCRFDGSVCDYYCSKALELGCTKSNYLVGFGQKYCKSYIRNAGEFTPSGREVLAKIRQCLIADLKSKSDLSCQNAESYGLHSHFGCYTESGYCALSLGDKMEIFWLAGRQIFNPKVRAALGQLDDYCSRHASFDAIRSESQKKRESSLGQI